MKKLSTEEEIELIQSTLSDRRINFVNIFIKTYNAKKACQEAPYNVKYYNAKAHSLLADERVGRLIELKLKILESRTRLSVSSTLKLIEEAMHVDPLDYLDPQTGLPLPLQDIPVNVRKSIQSLTITERRTKEGRIYAIEHTFRFIEKTRMIELLATIQKLKKDANDDLADNFVSKLQAAAQRVKPKKTGNQAGNHTGNPNLRVVS